MNKVIQIARRAIKHLAAGRFRPDHLVFAVVFTALLIVTRFVNLPWGLPYPMHPDERNMAVSIMQMECRELFSPGCLDPEFYAYGQFPLYLAYTMARLFHVVMGMGDAGISFEEATMALRVISAASSVVTGWLLLLIVVILAKKAALSVQGAAKLSALPRWMVYPAAAAIVFVPGLIQLAHFGTTEALLMLLYTTIAYHSLKLFEKRLSPLGYALQTGLATGAALATKVSALPYALVPLAALLLSYPWPTIGTKWACADCLARSMRGLARLASIGMLFIAVSLVIGLGLSPYNWIEFDKFMNSMSYESAVGFGTALVFYTRSFYGTAPVLFQFGTILPYALGLPLLILFMVGFFFLPWKHRGFLLLRIMFLLYFLPQSFLYAKWTRFIAPVFPLMVAIAVCALVFWYAATTQRFKSARRQVLAWWLFAGVVLTACLPGAAVLSIYVNPDVRYTASRWIFENIPDGAYILAETANVVDIPIAVPNTEPQLPPRGYQYISFDFYNLDDNPFLGKELETHLARAEYVFVNSRRVFKNHTCLEPGSIRKKALISIDQRLPVPIYTPIFDQLARCESLRQRYPQLHAYYDRLFNSGEYRLVGEFTSFPMISVAGYPILELPDENAEETWTVFDHPVIRIYQRVRTPLLPYSSSSGY